MLIYDIEIEKAIPPRDKNEERIEGIEYCDGWGDHIGMGISVVGAYDAVEDRYRVFMHDNMHELVDLAKRRFVVGFNSVKFDDRIMRDHGYDIRTDYDILLKAWDAAGARYQRGFKLDNLSEANGFGKKTGHGELAPVQWQRGEIATVIDYCLADVRLTWLLMQRIFDEGRLVDPRTISDYPVEWKGAKDLFFDRSKIHMAVVAKTKEAGPQANPRS